MLIDSNAKAIEILGIEDGDSVADVKKKYRKLVRRYHPDSYNGTDMSGAIEKILELNWAYDQISYLFTSDDTILNVNNSKDVDVWNIFSRGAVWPGAPKNPNAYCRRGDIHESIYGILGGEYYCWDPEYEDYEHFTFSIEEGIRNLFLQEIYASPTPFYLNRGTGFIFFTGFRNLLYIKLQREYLRPYFCLGKLLALTGRPIELNLSTTEFDLSLYENQPDENNTVTFKRTPSKTRVGIKFYDYENAVVSVDLMCTNRKGCSDAIEKLAVGDEVAFMALRDHPVYPGEMYVVDKAGKTLGRLPIPYCIVLGPLVLRNQVELRGIVRSILTREQQGSNRKSAKMSVFMYVHIPHPVNDYIEDNNSYIDKTVNQFKRLIHIQNKAKSNSEKDKLHIESFSIGKSSNLYERVLLAPHISYYFAGESMGELYAKRNKPNFESKVFDSDLFEVPEHILLKLFGLIELFTDKTKLLALSQTRENNRYLILDYDYMISLSFFYDKPNKGYCGCDILFCKRKILI